MARPKLGLTTSERLQMMMSKEDLEAIEAWRYKHRVPSLSEAVRRLCRIGLDLDEKKDKRDDKS